MPSDRHGPVRDGGALTIGRETYSKTCCDVSDRGAGIKGQQTCGRVTSRWRCREGTGGARAKRAGDGDRAAMRPAGIAAPSAARAPLAPAGHATRFGRLADESDRRGVLRPCPLPGKASARARDAGDAAATGRQGAAAPPRRHALPRPARRHRRSDDAAPDRASAHGPPLPERPAAVAEIAPVTRRAAVPVPACVSCTRVMHARHAGRAPGDDRRATPAAIAHLHRGHTAQAPAPHGGTALRRNRVDQTGTAASRSGRRQVPATPPCPSRTRFPPARGDATRRMRRLGHCRNAHGTRFLSPAPGGDARERIATSSLRVF